MVVPDSIDRGSHIPPGKVRTSHGGLVWPVIGIAVPALQRELADTARKNLSPGEARDYPPPRLPVGIASIEAGRSLPTFD